MSAAVQLLAGARCQFAVKGGGHGTIPGSANIDNGVLMAMKHLNQTELAPDHSWIRVGTGLHFGAIYEVLDPLHLTAVVGRVAEVGLGMAVGAGISYQTNEAGLVVDNVLTYEVVLANGTVVEARGNDNSATAIGNNSHADLHWALKGGNNNFGVVTSLQLRLISYPESIYGGVLVYGSENLDAVTQQLYDYHIRQAVEVPKMHALPQYTYNGTTDTAEAVIGLVVNDDVDELPEQLRGWLDIDSQSNTLRKRDNYTDLMTEVVDTTGNGYV